MNNTELIGQIAASADISKKSASAALRAFTSAATDTTKISPRKVMKLKVGKKLSEVMK